MVEGKPAKALVDTGSPASILSLEFLIRTSAHKEERQFQEAIRESVKSRLQPTPFHLKSYSGQNIPIVKQVREPSCLVVPHVGHVHFALIRLQRLTKFMFAFTPFSFCR